MSKYASKTTVSVEKSVAEIQRTLTRWGADGFGYFTQGDKAMVQFSKNDKVIKFILLMPDRKSDEIALTHYGYDRSAAAAEKAWEQACRQRWRALALIVKAKLEAVDSGIVTFESEFMAHIQLADGRTVGDIVLPEIDKAYSLGKAPKKLLLGGLDE